MQNFLHLLAQEISICFVEGSSPELWKGVYVV